MPWNCGIKDKIVWCYAKNGAYSVKSGYKVAMRLKGMAEIQIGASMKLVGLFCGV